MYTTRLQITNYGPIPSLDISFPFKGETPIPSVFVGPNGSGKSIVLSHIVNALLAAKEVVFPETPEVATGKAFKLRSNSYINSALPFFFSRVDFTNDLYFSELRTLNQKSNYAQTPVDIVGSEAELLWNKLPQTQNDFVDTNLAGPRANRESISNLIDSHALLYFPPDRFELPAWLNSDNLQTEAQHMTWPHVLGQTNRELIATSSLRQNRDWLFDVVYDRAAFEIHAPNLNLNLKDSPTPVAIPLFVGYSGEASTVFEAALSVVRTVTGLPTIAFGIGRRANRVVYLADGRDVVTPDVFQLSSGEVSVLNIGLSILRDFDSSTATFTSLADIHGLVVIDEIDLHLHATHQHDILPKLLGLFPNIQFVVTTHSPLFLLGMKRVFGDEGFVVYDLPGGKPIQPETFSEFEGAYRSLAETRKFKGILEDRVKEAQKPLLFPEGETDKRYIETAASLLGRAETLGRFEVWAGGGIGSLRKLWGSYTDAVAKAIPQDVVLLFDCDAQREPKAKGRIIQRTIPSSDENPVAKGIENLFGNAALERARSANNSFIDVASEHEAVRGGQQEHIPEIWTVNPDEKTNLCEWLCENGTAADFQGFDGVFDLLDEVLPLTESHT